MAPLFPLLARLMIYFRKLAEALKVFVVPIQSYQNGFRITTKTA
jgi:hypothetical protein